MGYCFGAIITRRDERMRSPRILLALLFATTSLGAPAIGQSQPAPNSAAPTVKSYFLNGAADATKIAKSHPTNGHRHKLNRRNLGSILEEDRDNVCYTMRSYIMARENRDSDSTKLVGYSTCQPSSKYELRITVENPKE
jgi:hypothetical protein